MFRRYLDRSMNELLLAGIDVTNDYAAVTVRMWGGDGDRDGDVDLADFAGYAGCFGGPGGPLGNCGFVDFDADYDVDLRDFGELQRLFTGPAG